MIWASRIWQGVLLVAGALAALWGLLAHARRQGRDEARQERATADAEETARRYQEREASDAEVERRGADDARDRLREWSRDR